MAESARWRPKRSTVWIVLAWLAAVIHGILERMASGLSGFFLAVAMIGMLNAGIHLRKEEDG